MSNQLKFLNNPKPEVKVPTPSKYIPQYKIHGMKPIEAPSHNLPLKSAIVSPTDPLPVIKQIPNIGNIDQTWSSVNEEIVDDLNLDPSHPMIDNNDFVNPHYMGINNATNAQTTNADELFTHISDLIENSYLLIVNGVSICSGPKNEIAELTQSLVYGNHPICDGNPIDINDIIIVKRVSIKMGLFLDQ